MNKFGLSCFLLGLLGVLFSTAKGEKNSICQIAQVSQISQLSQIAQFNKKLNFFLNDTAGYQIENFNDYISLPSNLGGGTIKGRASLQILLDENGKLNDVYIIQLHLKKGITPYLSFERDRSTAVEEITYPKKVRKYYPFLFNYVQKNFKFIKTGTNAEKINIIYIPVRLY